MDRLPEEKTSIIQKAAQQAQEAQQAAEKTGGTRAVCRECNRFCY